MGALEWIGAHLLGPFVNLYRAITGRPRPDIRILDVTPFGRAGSHLFFTIAVQNYATQPARVTVTAHVQDQTAIEHRTAISCPASSGMKIGSPLVNDAEPIALRFGTIR